MKHKLCSTLVFMLTLLPAAASAELIYVTTFDNRLLTFDSAAPDKIVNSVNLSGLDFPESLVGIDFRPLTGVLYSLGQHGRLSTIDLATGKATVVGTTVIPLSGLRFGFDFNPALDKIRVVSNLDSNLRIDPATGALAGTDTNLAYAAGDANAGANPNVISIAYNNNLSGVPVTTLFAIDNDRAALVKIDPPNTGALHTVGPLGVTPVGVSAALDISGVSGVAYAVLDPGPGPTFYTVNLTTGALTRVGLIGGSPGVVHGMSVAMSIGPCGPTTTTLCLNHDRFKVQLQWIFPDHSMGAGQAIALPANPDSGIFYFNNPADLQMLVKVLNGCGINSKFWVFFAATTNVEFTLTVTDTKNNTVKVYHNDQGHAAEPIQDTAAFATCP